ncbi:MAG: TolC family protein [Vulcanococcus sp.]
MTAAGAAALACLPGTALAQSASMDPLPKPLPQATAVKGQRPKSNPTVLPPAAIKLEPSLQRLAAPANLAIPTKPEQVRIVNMRPMSLKEVENLAEVNNPNLKAIASQVDQAQSNLRVQLAQWYPTLSLTANGFPNYTGGQQMANDANPNTQASGNQLSISNRWAMTSTLTAQWDVINPQRVPEVSAARDQFEKAKNQYLIGLREVRLEAAESYFNLNREDEQVRVGQQAVSASLISLQNAKARFQAGVATKLEVLQAETQLSQDRWLLDLNLQEQAWRRRDLARILNLPQDVGPTAKEPLQVVGLWKPTLEESVVAAYTFREELDNLILDISVSNSQANSALAGVQPFMTLVNSLLATRYTGIEQIIVDLPGTYGYAVENSVGLNFNWKLFDGGAARSLYRQYKQRAQENEYKFSDQRNRLRFEVEKTYYELIKANQNILSQSKGVFSARESLRLARLRFAAGVTTQLEVQQTQRDYTRAETAWAEAIADYNISLFRLRRFTGLDSIVECRSAPLPAVKPAQLDSETVPVPPSPLTPACVIPSVSAAPPSGAKRS